MAEMDEVAKLLTKTFGRNIEAIHELGNTNPLVEGMKVKCTSDYENNWGGCDQVKRKLEVGNIYTVKAVSVHSWHTKVCLEGFPNEVFNSVHFEEVETNG